MLQDTVTVTCRSAFRRDLYLSRLKALLHSREHRLVVPHELLE
jgi:hypothetical protein